MQLMLLWLLASIITLFWALPQGLIMLNAPDLTDWGAIWYKRKKLVDKANKKEIMKHIDMFMPLGKN